MRFFCCLMFAMCVKRARCEKTPASAGPAIVAGGERHRQRRSLCSRRGRRPARPRAARPVQGAQRAPPGARRARLGDRVGALLLGRRDDARRGHPARRRRSPMPAAAPARASPARPSIFSFATGLSRVLGLVREVVASYYFGAAGRDQRVHGRLPVPEPRPGARRRRRALLGVRPRLQRADREGRAQARLAGRLEPLLADAARPDRAQRALHPVAPWIVAPLRRPGRQRGPRGRALARALPDRRSCSASRGSSSGSSTPTTTSPCRRSRRSSGTSRSSPGLVLGVPRTNSSNTQLYIYAFAILIATFIQVFLPMPWLRGLDRGEERLRVVLDWRDPAVKQTFKLMLPVTLGLGLININALIDVFFASRYINPDLAPTAIQKAFLVYMLPQGMFSVAIATVLFPTHVAARRPRRPGRLPRHGRARPAPDHLPAPPGGGVQHRARDADHPHPLPARRLDTRPDARHGRLPRRLQRRPRLQRRDADAEPGVLQPAVELDPDGGRAREPVPERAPRLRSSIRSAPGGSRSRPRSSTSPGRSRS